MKAIYVSVCIIFMFVTGILQWDIFKLPWEYYRVLQALHIISSIAVSLLLIIPFLNFQNRRLRGLAKSMQMLLVFAMRKCILIIHFVIRFIK